MNATTKALIDRLPKKPLLAPADIAAVYGLRTSDPVLADIKLGRLAASRIGGRYVISLPAAEDYILKNEYTPDEGTI